MFMVTCISFFLHVNDSTPISNVCYDRPVVVDVASCNASFVDCEIVDINTTYGKGKPAKMVRTLEVSLFEDEETILEDRK